MNARQIACRGLVIAAVAAAFAGCTRRAAPEDCHAIFDRMVDLELERRGFRDPVLADKTRRELRQSLAPEIRKCEGHRISASARACVSSARSVEEITTACLR